MAVTHFHPGSQQYRQPLLLASEESVWAAGSPIAGLSGAAGLTPGCPSLRWIRAQETHRKWEMWRKTHWRPRPTACPGEHGATTTLRPQRGWDGRVLPRESQVPLAPQVYNAAVLCGVGSSQAQLMVSPLSP